MNETPATPDTTSASKATPPKTKRCRKRFFLWALGGAALAGVLYLYVLEPSSLPSSVNTPSFEENAQVEQNGSPTSIPHKESSVEKMEAEKTEEVTRLEERLQEMSLKLEALQAFNHTSSPAPSSEESAKSAEPTEQVANNAELERQLAMLQGRYEDAKRKNTILLTVGIIRERLDSATSFADAVNALRRIRIHNAALEAKADQGVATFATLHTLFNEAARTALPESLRRKPDASFWDKARYYMRDVIIIRPTAPDAEDNSEEAIISRAVAAMERQHVARTVQLLQQLSPETIKHFAPFLSEAKGRLEVQKALQDLFAEASLPIE